MFFLAKLHSALTELVHIFLQKEIGALKDINIRFRVHEHDLVSSVNWAQQRSLQFGPAVWKSPTCGTTVVLVLIMLTVMQLSLTAAPKVYRAPIIHLASTVNQETRSQCSKTTPLPSMLKNNNTLYPSFVVRCDHCQKSNEYWSRLPTGTHTHTNTHIFGLMFCRWLHYVIPEIFPIPLSFV